MAALSDYLESGYLNHLFRGEQFPTPTNISIALTSGVPSDNQDGSSIPEIPLLDSGGNPNGYSRIQVSTNDGNTKWNYLHGGSGRITNANQLIFNTALKDWGPVSGICILDSTDHGSGNLLMGSQLDYPRNVHVGDRVKFDSDSLEIFLK